MATSKAKTKPTKETKTKTASKTSKSKKAAEPVKRKVTSIIKSGPGEVEIRAKAQEIYNDRVKRGELGNAESDWLKAEKLLRG